MKKTILMVLGIVLLSIFMTGCGKQTLEKEELTELKIGISVYNQYDTFISEMMDEAQLYADEMAGFFVKTDDGSYTLSSDNRHDQPSETLHSTHGALTEAYEKFVKPSKLLEKSEQRDVIRVLDICSGIGYNSTALLTYLKDEDVLALSGLDDQHKYLFTIPFIVEKRIKENSIIEDCHVTLLNNRLVKIEVKEKKIVGYALENGLYVLVMKNGERSGLNNTNLYLISKVPLIEGFNEDELKQIQKYLGECDREVIDQISEIHNYPGLKYQNLELVMVDGNFIFTSVYGLNILEKYYKIESSYVSERRQCYYFEDISGNAYTSACPWEEVEETAEETQQEETDEEEG